MDFVLEAKHHKKQAKLVLFDYLDGVFYGIDRIAVEAGDHVTVVQMNSIRIRGIVLNLCAHRKRARNQNKPCDVTTQETVQSRSGQVIERYTLQAKSSILSEGRSIGHRIGAGRARVGQKTHFFWPSGRYGPIFFEVQGGRRGFFLGGGK